MHPNKIKQANMGKSTTTTTTTKKQLASANIERYFSGKLCSKAAFYVTLRIVSQEHNKSE